MPPMPEPETPSATPPPKRGGFRRVFRWLGILLLVAVVFHRPLFHTGVRLLLLDEPTEGLAPVIVQRIGEVLKALKERGMTIVLVEQNFRFASRIADRFYLMDHGQRVSEFPVGELPQRMDTLHKVLGV